MSTFMVCLLLVRECPLRKMLPDDVLIGELSAYTFRVQRYTGRYLYGAPPGLHDDTVIALALAWNLCSIPRLTLGIAVA